MFVDHFQEKLAGGEDTLSLLLCMAVANGNLALDGTPITEVKAKRYIIDYPSPNHAHFTDWQNLSKEIHDRIENCDCNPRKIEYHIFQLHLPIKDIAAYFHSKPTATKNQRAINAFLHCVTASIAQAQRRLEGVGFGSRANLGDYNHKWNKPCFHAVAQTGKALERHGNIIQGCLFENDVKTPLSEYERRCGIILTEAITADTLSLSMNWPEDLAHYYIQDGTIPAEPSTHSFSCAAK